MVKATLLGLTLVLAGTTHGHTSLNQPSLAGKTLGWLALSKPVKLFDRYIQSFIETKIFTALFGDEAAALLYQELGSEAQNLVGVPSQDQLKIKRIDPKSPMIEIAGAVTTANAIYVNEVKLDQRTYGDQRSALAHEAIHRKYCDSSMDNILEWTTMLLSGFATHKLIQALKPHGRFKVVHGITVVASAILCSSLTNKKFHNFMERRADIEGHYATGCSVCVHESALHRKELAKQNNLLLKLQPGYLNGEELEIIAQDLAEQNKLCAYHAVSAAVPAQL